MVWQLVPVYYIPLPHQWLLVQVTNMGGGGVAEGAGGEVQVICWDTQTSMPVDQMR